MGYGDMTPGQVLRAWAQTLAWGAVVILLRRPLQLALGGICLIPIWLYDKLRSGA